jgi:hypothetical protein
VLRSEQDPGIQIGKDLLIVEAMSRAGLVRSADRIGVVSRSGYGSGFQSAVPDSPGLVGRWKLVAVERPNEISRGVKKERDLCGVLGMQRKVERLLVFHPGYAQRRRRALAANHSFIELILNFNPYSHF